MGDLMSCHHRSHSGIHQVCVAQSLDNTMNLRIREDDVQASSSLGCNNGYASCDGITAGRVSLSL